MAGTRTMGTTLVLTRSGSEAENHTFKHLQSIGEQGTEAEEIDVTTLDSPNGAKEYIQGAKDPGTVEVTANNCGDGEVTKLQALFASGEVREWTETYPNGASLTFNAYVSQLTFGEATTEGLCTATFALRLTGEPTYAEASA